MAFPESCGLPRGCPRHVTPIAVAPSARALPVSESFEQLRFNSGGKLDWSLIPERLYRGAHLIEVSHAGVAYGQMLFEPQAINLRQALFEVVGYQLRQFLARQFGFPHDDLPFLSSNNDFQEYHGL